MLEYTIKEAWTSADLKELKKKLSQLKVESKPFYEQCKVWVNQSVQARTLAEASAASGGELANNELVTNIMANQDGSVPMRFGTGTYGHDFNMNKAFRTLNEKVLWSRETCRLCSDLPDRPHSTDCGHVFCHDCITTYMHSVAANGEEYDDVCHFSPFQD